jgi:predicted nicotinamide N-methyase
MAESGDSARWAALPGAGSSSDDDDDAAVVVDNTAGLAAAPRTRGAIGSVSAAAPGDSSAGGGGGGCALVRPATTAPDALSIALGPLSLTIAHDPASGLAHRVWPSSLALAAQALKESSSLDGTWAVELGCGPGLAGVAWAAAGARVVLTDLEGCLPLARRSIDLSGLGDRAAVARLGWGEPGGPAVAAGAAAEAGWWRAEGGETLRPAAPDLVLAADVVYDLALFDPLLRTLADFGAAGTRRVLLAHVRRWKSDKRFWAAARKAWDVRDVTEGGESGDDGRRHSSHERGAQRVFELVWKG